MRSSEIDDVGISLKSQSDVDIAFVLQRSNSSSVNLAYKNCHALRFDESLIRFLIEDKLRSYTSAPLKRD